jgi:hypothetical protein
LAKPWERFSELRSNLCNKQHFYSKQNEQQNLRHKNVDFQCKSIEFTSRIFVTVLILHPTLIFLAFRAYLLEPPPQDYISKGKTIEKSQNSNEVKNDCTRSRVRIVSLYSNYEGYTRVTKGTQRKGTRG